MARIASRRRGIWRLAFLIIILAIIGSYVSPVRDYIDRARSIAEERATTGQLSQQHDSLQTEKDRLGDTAYVEQVARRDLGLVKPGEQPYVVKDLSQDEPETAPQAVAATEEKPIYTRVVDAVRSILP